MRHPSRAPRALAGVAGAAILAASLGTSALAQEPVTISYFTFSAAPDHLEDLQTIVDAFEAEHPNITIDVRTAAYTDYFTALQTQVAGGQAPDTFELNYENFVTYADAGSLLDLSDAIAGDTSFDASVYYPRAYEVFSQDGVQYGVPEQFSDVLLFYNKDLFDAKGVAYPDATWTWADELAAAEQLTDTATGTWGDFQPIQFFEFYKVLAQNGGSFFSDDGTKATFDSPEGVAAAEWLIDKVGKVMPPDAFGPDQDKDLFLSGKLGMWHTGIWLFSALKDAPFTWDVSVEPGNVKKAHQFFANGIVASAATQHPAEAWAWMRFLTSSDTAVKTRLASSWELPAVADQSLFTSYLEQTPPENREAVFEALADIVTPPVIVAQQQMQDIVTQALESARLGQVSVQDALTDAAAQVTALIAQ